MAGVIGWVRETRKEHKSNVKGWHLESFLIGFRLGEYNRQYQVVIDPTYQWHTFYGDTDGWDQGNAIAVDSADSVSR